MQSTFSSTKQEIFMKHKTPLSRMTIDISEDEHKQFKAMAAFMGKSMRELVVEAVRKQIKTHQPKVLQFTETK